MRFISLSHEHQAIITEIQRQTDRAAALVAFSFLENRLADLLRVKFEDFPDIANRVLKGFGPLATFAAKNDIALLMGIYGEQEHRDLITLKDIRNNFAHAEEPITFQTQSVVDLCKNLLSVQQVERKDARSMLKAMGTGAGREALEIFLEAAAVSPKTPRQRYTSRVAFYYFSFGVSKEFYRREKLRKQQSSPGKSGQPRPQPPRSPNPVRKRPKRQP